MVIAHEKGFYFIRNPNRHILVSLSFPPNPFKLWTSTTPSSNTPLPACETLDDEGEKVNEFRTQSCSALETKLTEKGKNLSDLLLLYPPLCTVRSAIIEHLSLGKLDPHLTHVIGLSMV